MTPVAPSFASELSTEAVLSKVGLGESFLGIISDYNSGEEGKRAELSES